MNSSVRIKDVKAKGSMQIYLENSIHTGFLYYFHFKAGGTLLVSFRDETKKNGNASIESVKKI